MPGGPASRHHTPARCVVTNAVVGTYQPIEDYGIIGDLHTVALVGKNGSIDFLSFPHLRLADDLRRAPRRREGRPLQICPRLETGGTNKQMYLPDTNILITRFLAAEGVGEVSDFMPVAIPGTTTAVRSSAG